MVLLAGRLLTGSYVRFNLVKSGGVGVSASAKDLRAGLVHGGPGSANGIRLLGAIVIGAGCVRAYVEPANHADLPVALLATRRLEVGAIVRGDEPRPIPPRAGSGARPRRVAYFSIAPVRGDAPRPTERS